MPRRIVRGLGREVKQNFAHISGWRVFKLDLAQVVVSKYEFKDGCLTWMIDDAEGIDLRVRDEIGVDPYAATGQDDGLDSWLDAPFMKQEVNRHHDEKYRKSGQAEMPAEPGEAARHEEGEHPPEP